jgi:hypothetical protein
MKIRGVGQKYAAIIRTWQRRAQFAPEVAYVGPMIVADARHILEFLAQIIGIINTKGGHMQVDFSPPPEGGRAVVIARAAGFGGQAVFPPYDDFKQSLVDEYGKPVIERARVGGGNLLWAYPEDEKVCLDTSAYLRIPVNPCNYDLSNPAACASMRLYSLDTSTAGAPVQRVNGTLVDVAESVRTDQVAKAWLAKLTEEARAARSAGAAGKSPDR